jgi:uncharacterized membrane protein YkoI
LKTSRHVVLLFTITLTILPVAYSEETPGAAAQKLADQVKGSKVSLERGLQVSTKEGTPISGKFEIEDGKLQLSVYTEKAGRYYEVVVDHKSGKIAKVEEITSGDDLTAARAQAEAMTKAKRSLRDAVNAAQIAHKGFHATSVTPSLKAGHAIATVTVNKGHESRTVTEKLD